jgi:hypothetical protein
MEHLTDNPVDLSKTMVESTEDRLYSIEQQLRAIQERNARVELDKRWEVSTTRRLLVAVITYAFAALFLRLIGNDRYLLNALVPTAGYVLSTLTLPWVKQHLCKG